MRKLQLCLVKLLVVMFLVFAGSCVDKKNNPVTPGQEVDLGLPSGTKWAGWNVGASSPEEYGGYYAWGETEEKSNYTEKNYKFWVDSDEFSNIGSNISGTQYDVARQKWGGSWRMPTKAEFDELTSKCTWTWYQYKGVSGYKVTGPNGNSIFLPAAGFRNGNSLDHAGSHGNYWSASLGEVYYGNDAWNLAARGQLRPKRCAWGLIFRNRFYSSNGGFDRNNGHMVRPVKSEAF